MTTPERAFVELLLRRVKAYAVTLVGGEAWTDQSRARFRAVVSSHAHEEAARNGLRSEAARVAVEMIMITATVDGVPIEDATVEAIAEARSPFRIGRKG